MNELIASSELIVCRSGYSSIMDLHAMKKKAIFIPTPGQTEQEYLARELERMGIAFYQSQRQFNLLEAIAKSKKYSGFVDFEHTSNLLQNAISDLLNFKTIPKI
jgi:UDP-N-acetylglucosamine:LPS N-acetylglucosamine transferase